MLYGTGSRVAVNSSKVVPRTSMGVWSKHIQGSRAFGGFRSGFSSTCQLTFGTKIINHSFTTSSNQPIKPKPLSLRTIVTLIVVASTSSMSFYLTYQILKFINDNQETNHTKAIFLPLWIHTNWIYCKTYSMDQFPYLNSTIPHQAAQNMLNKFSTRIKFKLYQFLDTNKFILNQQLINTNLLQLQEEEPVSFGFKILTPYISGLKFTTQKLHQQPKTDAGSNNLQHLMRYKNHDIYCGWSLQLVDFDNVQMFLLNQPHINFHNQLSFEFTGKYSLKDNVKQGYLKFSGSIEACNNNITFTRVVLYLYEEDKLVEYKVV